MTTKQRRRRVASEEEDLLTEATKAVYDALTIVVDRYDYADFKGSSKERQTAIINFVEKVIFHTPKEETLLDEVRWAAQDYRRSLAMKPPNGYRQLAVALVNAAYNYIVENNPDWTDETIDNDIDALVANHGFDPAIVNELIESIYQKKSGQ